MPNPTQTQQSSPTPIGKPYRSARFLVPAEITLPTKQLPQPFEITDKTLVHRATKVLRMAVDDSLALIDPTHEVAVLAKIQAISSQRISLTIEAIQPHHNTLPHITLLAGLIKGHRWDWLIEKATELGLRRIIPIQSDHAVVDLSGKDVSKKVAKWQQTAMAAVEQCDGRFIPEITELMSVNDALTFLQTCPQSFGKGSKTLMTESGYERIPLATSITDNHYPEALVMAIGPEGGWSTRECEAMRADGFINTQLGTRILRAETAAMTALSIITGLYDQNPIEQGGDIQ